MAQKTRTFRSPLKAAPLHSPGQSIDTQLNNLFDESITPWVIIALAMTMMGFMDLYRWYFDIPLTPQTPLALMVLTWIGFTWVVFRTRRKAKELKLARDGERAVGQYLDRLRESGAQIFHDVPAEKTNLDHVIISRQGIFVVETMTLNKPAQGKPEITVRDGVIYANDSALKTDLIEHSLSLGDWLTRLLVEKTGKRCSVQPAIVFPGWFVHRVNLHAGRGVWVLNPKALPAFIASTPQQFTDEEVKEISTQLSRHIRSLIGQ